MGRDATTSDLSDDDLIKALKALADPTRFRMVQAISAAGELSCAQATELFDVSQPTISHHLKVLVDANVIVRRTQGKQAFTSVNHALLGEIGAALPVRFAPFVAGRGSLAAPLRRARG